MKFTNKMRFSFSIVGSLGILVFAFQNCSTVQFESNDELVLAGIEGKLKSISFSPQTAESRPDLDVTTILDDSNSMSFIQTNVKDALATTTSALRGFAGTFNLFTTTQDLNYPSASRKPARYFKLENQMGQLQPIDNLSQDQLTQYKTQLDNDGNPLHSSYEEWVEHKISSPYNSVRFEPNMNDQDFETFQSQVANEIQKVNTSGSPEEMGLCTLLRKLESSKNTGGFHTYIIATNEDDATTSNNCLKSEVKRWEREQRVTPGNTENCNPGEANCQFPYTITYKAPVITKNQYKRSFVESQRIAYSLKTGSLLKTESRRLTYPTTQRFATHRINQTKWEIQFQRNVVIGNNDGLPIYQLRTEKVAHSGRPLLPGVCDSGSTSFQSCSGTDLNHFNSVIKNAYANVVDNSCQVLCTNQKTAELRDNIDAQRVPTTNPVTFSDTILNASKMGYTNGCVSYVANTRGYDLNTVPNNAITDCALKFETVQTVTRDHTLQKSIGSCSTSTSSCSLEEKGNSIIALGLNTIDPSLMNCQNRCSTANLSSSTSSASFSERISGQELCPGKQIGEANADVRLTCNSAELQKALSNLNSSLASQGITSQLDEESINCQYTCAHRSSGFTTLGSSITLNPRQETPTQSLDCNSAPFSSLNNPNLFDCRLHVELGPQPASRTFSSLNPNICNGNYSLESIRSYPEATNIVLDHGPSAPLDSCIRGTGNRAGAQSIDYVWKLLESKSHSFMNEASVVETVVQKLKQAHGNNFHLVAFINNPDQEASHCQGVNLADYYGPSNSLDYEGKKFKDLALALGHKHVSIFPACMANYRSAMKFVFDLVVTSVNKSYKLSIDPNNQEWVYRVQLQKASGQMKLLSPEDYRIEHDLIVFSDHIDLSDVARIHADIVTPL